MGHVVYTSYVGATPDAVFTLARNHWRTERMIAELGLDATILRDSMYLDMAEGLVQADGVIRGPAGDGRVAMVARDDVAAVAAAVLLAPDEHRGRTYDVTGPEALTLAEVAEVLSDVRGRPVAFHDETVEEAYASRASYGAPQWEVDAWVSTYLAVRSGDLAQVSDTVPTILGRPAAGLEDVLRRG